MSVTSLPSVSAQSGGELANLLPAEGPRLWARQAIGILRLEIRKSFLGRRSLPIYLLAALPVLLVIGYLAAHQEAWRHGSDAAVEIQVNGTPLRGPGPDGMTMAGAIAVYAPIFVAFQLMAVVFFGCVQAFMNLFRGDVIDRSLHFYFLTPVRREVLITGKYLAGLLTVGTLFSLSTATTLLLLFANTGGGLARALGSGGLATLLGHVGVTLLGVVGYGAVFLVLGLFFRNPVVPGLAVYGWELGNFLLPPLLKKFSVIYYLKALSPVPISEGPFALLADPPPAVLSVLGLLLVVAALLAVAGWRARRMEIRYSED